MASTFAIIGSGAWGTTIAILLARNPSHRVRLWSYRPEVTRQLRECRQNAPLLPGITIPEAVELFDDIHAAVRETDLCIVAVPTVYLRATLTQQKPVLDSHTAVLSLCKGLENKTFDRPTEILREVVGDRPIAILSGPSHAEEVARSLPASVVAASTDVGLAKRVQEWFTTARFRVYTNPDVIGVELAGALKNVIAIAAGICDGLNLGDNAKAALLTRGIVEMARFGIAHGATPETFNGLAGIGDLIATCTSCHGRNRRVGERLAHGVQLKAILASTEMVAEGVYTARSVYEKANKMGLELPICNEVYRVLYEDKSPRAAVESLMQRTPVPERRSD